MTTTFLDILIAVLHVPYATCANDTAEAFWCRFESVLSSGHWSATYCPASGRQWAVGFGDD